MEYKLVLLIPASASSGSIGSRLRMTAIEEFEEVEAAEKREELSTPGEKVVAIELCGELRRGIQSYDGIGIVDVDHKFAGHGGEEKERLVAVERRREGERRDEFDFRVKEIRTVALIPCHEPVAPNNSSC
ncbi:unnamed protein product [Linum trigynum]|uniref:Uncharacterized protein n=1 Tax=Linum trigynum TaxID=586398 RepID=A0AAV2G723_9ROSI